MLAPLCAKDMCVSLVLHKPSKIQSLGEQEANVLQPELLLVLYEAEQENRGDNGERMEPPAGDSGWSHSPA